MFPAETTKMPLFVVQTQKYCQWKYKCTGLKQTKVLDLPMFVSKDNQCITSGAVTFSLNNVLILAISIQMVHKLCHEPESYSDTNQEKCLTFLVPLTKSIVAIPWYSAILIFIYVTLMARNIYHMYVPY